MLFFLFLFRRDSIFADGLMENGLCFRMNGRWFDIAWTYLISFSGFSMWHVLAATQVQCDVKVVY